MAGFSIRNPYFIVVICLIVAVVGVTALVRMPVDLFPAIDLPVVVVATFYNGMPPEQIEGKELDGRADVYALGCVLFQCLTGSAPFEKDSEVATLYAHMLEPPPSVTGQRPELPGAIDKVIARGLAKKPDERYTTCRELTRAAREALGVSGEATALREAAAIEVSHRRERQLRDVARAVGDDRAQLQARELFRSGRFDDVVKALEGLFASRLEGCPRPDVQERRLFEFTLRVATVKHPTMKERSSF